jgi:probable addiction module antidote protein
MSIKLTPYDPAEMLNDPESVAIFLADVFETSDPAFIAHALGIAARSAGMTEIARKTGLSREALYRSLTENGNPSLRSLMGVLDALGLKMTVRPKDEQRSAAE